MLKNIYNLSCWQPDQSNNTNSYNKQLQVLLKQQISAKEKKKVRRQRKERRKRGREGVRRGGRKKGKYRNKYELTGQTQ